MTDPRTQPSRFDRAALALLGLALLASRSAAQTVAALPRVLSGAFATEVSGFAPESKPKWYQFWFHGQNLPIGSIIREISVRPDDTLASPQYRYTFSMTMSNTAVDARGLGPTLAKHHGKDKTVVVPLRTMTCQASTAGGSADRGQCWIPLSQPFKFTGPHLLIEIYVKEVVTASPTGNDFFRMGSRDSYHVNSGTSCRGASLTASYASESYTLRLQSVPANQIAVFMVASENVLGPNGLLPCHLGPIGMPGCELRINPVFWALIFANNQGEALVRVPYQPGPGTSTVFVQAVHANANSSKLETTNAVHSVFGRTGLCNTIVSDNGVNANPGFPFDHNGSPVFLWR